LTVIFANWKLLRQPLKERRWPLEIFFAQYLAQNPTFQLSPITRQIDIGSSLARDGQRKNGRHYSEAFGSERTNRHAKDQAHA
jgi:hypothetical protein